MLNATSIVVTITIDEKGIIMRTDKIYVIRDGQVVYLQNNLDTVVSHIQMEMIKNAKHWITGIIKIENCTIKTQLPFFVTTALEHKLISFIVWTISWYKEFRKDNSTEENQTGDYLYDNDFDISYDYNIWSNIHHGYVGRAAGLTKHELLSGAGVTQYLKYQDLNETFWEILKHSPLKAFSSLNNRANQNAIKIGFKLWEQYHLNITKNQILTTVREFHEYLKIKQGRVEGV